MPQPWSVNGEPSIAAINRLLAGQFVLVSEQQYQNTLARLSPPNLQKINQCTQQRELSRGKLITSAEWNAYAEDLRGCEVSFFKALCSSTSDISRISLASDRKTLERQIRHNMENSNPGLFGPPKSKT